MPIAIGVPIRAAALFDTMLVISAISSIRPLSSQAGDVPAVAATNNWAR